MANTSVSVRSLARLCGLSKATVANALRGDASVAKATAEKVLAVAKREGYRRNPMVGTIMSALRKAQVSGYHGTLACLHIAEPDRPAHTPFQKQLVLGLKERAAEIGYKVEEFVVGPQHLSLSRLEGILKARGISGILLMPSWRAPDLGALDWSYFSVVAADRIEAPQQFHAVCVDQYRSIQLLLERVRAAGYRRPGLMVEREREQRVQARMGAAYHAFLKAHANMEALPILEEPIGDGSAFKAWFRAHQPDVVLCHYAEVQGWMAECGRGGSESVGFISLNLAKSNARPAGLDLQPRVIGARCVELLCSQLQHNERGIPESPMTLTLPARFVAGPSFLEPKPTRAEETETTLRLPHQGRSLPCKSKKSGRSPTG